MEFGLENLVKKEGLSFRIVDGEGVLYNPETKSLHILNKTASFIWELLDGTHSLSTIEKKMGEKFAANQEKIHLDVVNCLKRFEKEGLLQEREVLSK